MNVDRWIGGQVELFCILDPEYYEDLANYRSASQPDYGTQIGGLLPETWIVKPDGICYYAQPRKASVPEQGFKIHLSATEANASRLLDATVAQIAEHGCSFKVVADNRALRLVNSKNFPRARSGKFVTVYPQTQEICGELLRSLSAATEGLAGPYILSDKPYKTSRTVFYRYGAFVRESAVNMFGERTMVMRAPDGRQVEDRRTAVFSLPVGVVDVFDPQVFEKRKQRLLNGAYVVESAILFSNRGGVYRGRTLTDRQVIIKEARPFVTIGRFSSVDAVVALRNEYQVLKALSQTGFAPEAIDYFTEWEHEFLIMSKVDGLPITKFRSIERNSLLLSRTRSREQTERFLGIFHSVARQLIHSVRVCHEKGIILADLSANNVLIDPETYTITLVDFESAVLPGAAVHDGITPFTPGFASPHRQSGGSPRQKDDWYAASGILASLILPIQALTRTDGDVSSVFLETISSEIQIPEQIFETINALRAGDCARADRALEKGQAMIPFHHPLAPFMGVTAREANECVDNIAQYILATASPERKDRVWPADHRVFVTNPLSIAHGAMGIASLLLDTSRPLPAWFHRYVKQRLSEQDLAPGLYVGRAGIAWMLRRIGLAAEAEVELRLAHTSPLLKQSFDVYYGCAGIGLIDLLFWHETQDPIHLERAVALADRLIPRAKIDVSGYYWPAADDTVYIGFAYGASGIALFMLGLYECTHDSRYLDCAVAAFDFDLCSGSEQDGSIGWERLKGDGSVWPYWSYGSAGVGAVALRFSLSLNEDRYLDVARKAARFISAKYSVFPGQMNGMAGMGEFLLDLWEGTGETSYRDEAAAIARRVMAFRLNRGAGAAFPGDGLLAISDDYSGGSAGVGLFLNHLAAAFEGNRNALRPSLRMPFFGVGEPKMASQPLGADLVSR